MGLDQFIKDPKVYLKGHGEVRMNQTRFLNQAFKEGVRLPIPGGGFSKQFTPRSDMFSILVPFISTSAMNEKKEAMTFKNTIRRHVGLAQGMRRSYDVQSGSTDLGIQWLPYEAGVVTYMPVSTTAKFIGTGELSGCTIAAGVLGGTLYYFHAFAPAGYNGPAARQKQKDMIDFIAGNSQVTDMVYADNTIDYNGFAFGYGRKDGSKWKLYVYGSESGVKKMGECRL